MTEEEERAFGLISANLGILGFCLDGIMNTLKLLPHQENVKSCYRAAGDLSQAIAIYLGEPNGSTKNATES